MGADAAMHGLVAVPAQVVEELGGLWWNDAAGPQAGEQVELVPAVRRGPAGLSATSADDLREAPAKLPQLDDAGVGVLGEVLLRECRQPREQRVVLGEEDEIRRGDRHRSRHDSERCIRCPETWWVCTRKGERPAARAASHACSVRDGGTEPAHGAGL